jgi:hypothetical protein
VFADFAGATPALAVAMQQFIGGSRPVASTQRIVDPDERSRAGISRWKTPGYLRDKPVEARQRPESLALSDRAAVEDFHLAVRGRPHYAWC